MNSSISILLLTLKKNTHINNHLQKIEVRTSIRQEKTLKAFYEALEQEVWDVIVCDLADGSQHMKILKIIQNLNKKELLIPLIVFFEELSDELILKGIEAGVYDYIHYQNLSRSLFSIKRGIRETQIRKSEHVYRTLVENSNDIIIAFNLEGTISFINSSGLEQLGFLKSEVQTLNIQDLLHPKRIDKNKEQYFYQADLKPKNKKLIPVEVNSSILIEQGKPSGMMVSARDITEKIQAEKQAKIIQNQLYQASKMVSLGTLVAGMAHEINNPITSVILNAPILIKIWEGLLPIIDAYIEEHPEFMVANLSATQFRERAPLLVSNIYEAAKRVKALVEDLKDFARERPVEINDMVDLNQVVEKSISLVSILIKKSTDNFFVEYHPDLPKIKGSARRIEQVVINLLVNACQALMNKEQSIKVSTGYDPIQKNIYIAIQDDGIGMTKKVLEQVKDPFFTTKRDSGGTGLGLSISTRIIFDHEGTLDFFSESEKGTLVKATFPVPE